MSHILAVIGRRLMLNIQPSMNIHESAVLQAEVLPNWAKKRTPDFSDDKV